MDWAENGRQKPVPKDEKRGKDDGEKPSMPFKTIWQEKYRSGFVRQPA